MWGTCRRGGMVLTTGLVRRHEGERNVTPQDVARILIDVGAVRVVERPEPGRRRQADARLELDVCRLSTRPEQQRLVRDRLVTLLRAHAPSFDVIVSPNTASLPLATLVASALGCAMVYVRPKPKSHGKQRQIEGVLPAGARGLLVFDQIADGGVVRESADVLARHGATVAACAALLVGDPSLAEAARPVGGGPLLSLTDERTVLELLGQVGRPAPNERTDAEPSERGAGHWEPGRAVPDEAAQQRGRQVAEALLRIGAVTIDTTTPFRYTSGILSPIYTDNRLLISYPDEWNVVVEGFAGALARIVASGTVDVLAGAATAGIPHAARLAERTGVPMVYVEAAGGEPEAGERVRGALAAGASAVIVEDLVTTGKSVLETVAALRKRGAKVGWCLAIFTYSPEKARAAFERERVSFVSLCDLDTLLDVAVTSGYIDDGARRAVLDWLVDPRAWTERAEARRAATT